MSNEKMGSGPIEKVESGVNVSFIIIGAVLLLFLVIVLIPQDFWVNLSMKLFP